MEVAKDKMINDKSVWDRFEDSFVSVGYPWNKHIKGVVKTQYYATAYGGSKTGTAKRLAQFARENPDMAYVGEPEFKQALFNNPVFKSLVEGGDGWRKEMIANGEACNVYGQCFKVDNQKKARSIQSAIAQSYESAYINRIMYPRIEKGEKEETFPFKVLYYGFDGAGIVPKKGVSMDKVNEFVQKRALSVEKELGLKHMGMEVKPGDLAALEDLDYTREEIEKLRMGIEI